MIKATIEYADGTEAEVKKKSLLEFLDYYDNERTHGAIGFKAKSDLGNAIESRECYLVSRGA